MTYLLDTNVVIAITRRNAGVLARLREIDPAEFGISAVASHELYYGAFKSADVSKNLDKVERLRLPVVEFDREDAREAGAVRAALAAAGTPIGPYDVLIAGQARARSLVLVTANVREFARVPGLRVQNWEPAPG